MKLTIKLHPDFDAAKNVASVDAYVGEQHVATVRFDFTDPHNTVSTEVCKGGLPYYVQTRIADQAAAMVSSNYQPNRLFPKPVQEHTFVVDTSPAG